MKGIKLAFFVYVYICTYLYVRKLLGLVDCAFCNLFPHWKCVSVSGDKVLTDSNTGRVCCIMYSVQGEEEFRMKCSVVWQASVSCTLTEEHKDARCKT